MASLDLKEIIVISDEEEETDIQVPSAQRKSTRRRGADEMDRMPEGGEIKRRRVTVAEDTAAVPLDWGQLQEHLYAKLAERVRAMAVDDDWQENDPLRGLLCEPFAIMVEALEAAYPNGRESELINQVSKLMEQLPDAEALQPLTPPAEPSVDAKWPPSIRKIHATVDLMSAWIDTSSFMEKAAKRKAEKLLRVDDRSMAARSKSDKRLKEAAKVLQDREDKATQARVNRETAGSNMDEDAGDILLLLRELQGCETRQSRQYECGLEVAEAKALAAYYETLDALHAVVRHLVEVWLQQASTKLEDTAKAFQAGVATKLNGLQRQLNADVEVVMNTVRAQLSSVEGDYSDWRRKLLQWAKGDESLSTCNHGLLSDVEVSVQQADGVAQPCPATEKWQAEANGGNEAGVGLPSMHEQLEAIELMERNEAHSGCRVT